MYQRDLITRKSEVISRRTGTVPLSSQTGASLVEILIAMVLSLVVSASAVVMLSHSIGTNSVVLQYTLLSEELRFSLQTISRDVRRAGYTAGAQWCLANTLCLPDTTISLPTSPGTPDQLPLITSFDLPAGIQIDGEGECFTFELDRDQDATIGDGDYGGYRLSETNGTGVLLTWTGQGAPVCSSQMDNWSPMTNQDKVNITEFLVDDSESFDEDVSTDLLGNTTTQSIRRIRIRISGQLINNEEVDETVETLVDVKNDVLI